MNKRAPLVNLSHYLLCCRFDNWIRLLIKNRPAVTWPHLPQAALITVSSLLLSPFALLEAALFNRRIRKTEMDKAPVYIVGHWRSGTTFLHNIMSRDPQFGWADPVGTASLPNRLLLKPFLTFAQRRLLKNARPMDNMRYEVTLPFEETFGLASISEHSIVHAVSFPDHFKEYLPAVFVADMDEKQKRAWQKQYSFVLQKLTYTHKNKRLLLKSPDNTGHLRELLELYPDARFINIYRDPYTTMLSTVNMYKKQMERMCLSRLPEGDIEIMLEDVFLDIFERMYRELFTLQQELPQNRFVELQYERFAEAPEEHLRRIYEALELPGFDEALPAFRAYIASQAGYVKNRFSLQPRLRDKINSRLGFYFAHYGYEMEAGRDGASGQAGE